ncbi:MAG: PVC-type heme-binding CxxCH protein [Fuerstiella sp.]
MLYPRFNPLARVVCVVAVVFSFGSSANAQRDLKDIPIPDPELERQTFVVPEGFEVSLFAADPRIAKPIQMNFDADGRLWIVSSEVYPQIKPGDEPSDRVVVLEDTDHDGVSDKTHIFAEGLLIPTGIAPGDGGAYVANSTELLHFADTDGDLKADSKRVVLSGFGTEDTHHILHTLRWGYDGYLYFNQSIYIHSHIETPWGVRRLNAGGIWQFRPETLELGVFMRGLVNSWGHHFDRFGQSFATDGAGGEGINYVVPGAYYFTAADAPQILHGLNPGSPKHCGLEIVETPMLPPDWQGCAITNDFRGHRVCRFKLSEDRSGYVSQEQQEVIASNHVAFRPIDVKLGPDGAIYIADWYNPIIQHGEVDFRDPRRDHTHGRIWRVVWKGAPKREWTSNSNRSVADLLASLTSSDNFERQAARHVLREKGQDILPELKTWADSIDVTSETEHQRLEALWCFQSQRTVNEALLKQLLAASDGRVRAAAIRVLSHWKHEFPESSLAMLEAAITDEHPRVRLEAVRAISFSPNEASERETAADDFSGKHTANSDQSPLEQPSLVELAMRATDRPTDTFIDYAVWLTARELSPIWLPEFQRGGINFSNNVEHLLTAFGAVGQGAPVDFLLTRLYSPTTSATQRSRLVDVITTSGNADQIKQLVVAAAGNSDAAAIRSALAATKGRNNMTVGLPIETQQQMLASATAELRTVGLIAVGQWKVKSAIQLLKAVVGDDAKPMEDRLAAAEGIALSGDATAVSGLAKFASEQQFPTALRKHAAALLVGLNPGRGADVAVGLFSKWKSEDHPEDLIRSFMAVKNGDRLLTGKLAFATLDSAVARELLRVVREAGRPAAELEAALIKAGNITSRKAISKEEREAILQTVANSVSAAEGELIFRNEKFSCVKCHAIGGAGGKVGPDMVSLGGSAQPDYLLESLLNPNAKVKENYNTIVVATTDGKVISGVQVKRSKEEVVVRTANDELVTISGADIDEIADGVSLMPEGLVDVLTDRELAALVRFLSELGRTPDYTIGRRQLARTWNVMNATDEAAFKLRRTSYATAATDDPAFAWAKVYSTVSGGLPVMELPVVSVKNRSAAGSRGVGFARCYLSVETPGTVSLKLNSSDGLELRINELPVDLLQPISLELQPGLHRLTFSVDQTQRSEPLELELETEGTSAVAKFVN